MEEQNLGYAPVKKKRFSPKTRDLFFYIAILVLPLIQFAIFYIGVNVNSFIIAFQDPSTGQPSLSNFQEVFADWGTVLNATKMSLITYAISLFVGVPLGIVFAYYIYKKFFGHALFRIILYIPSILSIVIMTTLYQLFLSSDFITNYFGENPLMSIEFSFAFVCFFNIFISFGTSVIMYTNKMSSINPELIESCNLDGARKFKEFWYIVLPQSFSTISVFLVTGVATIFTNQWALYLLYQTGLPNEELRTLGYYLFVGVTKSAHNELGRWSALGLLMSAVAIPLTFIIKSILDRFGPKEK